MQSRTTHVGIRGERVAIARPPESGLWFLAGLIGLATGLGAGGVTIALAISSWHPTALHFNTTAGLLGGFAFFSCQVCWWLQWSLCFGWIVLRHRVARLRPWLRWLVAALLTVASWVGAGAIWELGFWLW